MTSTRSGMSSTCATWPRESLKVTCTPDALDSFVSGVGHRAIHVRDAGADQIPPPLRLIFRSDSLRLAMFEDPPGVQPAAGCA